MPKIPRRQESTRPSALPGARYIPPVDPTGGLRVVSQVSSDIRNDALRKVELVKRDVENLQTKAFENGTRALRTQLAAEYNTATPDEILNEEEDYIEGYLLKYKEGVSKLLEGMPAYRREEFKDFVELGAAETRAALQVKHQSALNESLMKEWNESLTMTKQELFNGIRNSNPSDINGSMKFVAHKLGQIKSVVEEGFGASQMQEGETAGYVRDQQGEAVQQSIRAALDEDNVELAKEIYAQYAPVINDTPYGKVGETEMSRYIKIRAEDSKGSNLIGNLRREFLLNDKYRRPGGELSSEGQNALYGALHTLLDGEDQDVHDRVWKAVDAMVADDANRVESARVERVNDLIADLSRKGQRVWIPTAENYEMLGTKGVDTVLSHLGQGKGRTTQPGAIDGLSDKMWGDEERTIEDLRKHLRGNKSSFSEADYQHYMTLFDGMEERDRKARENPDRYGSLTATQAGNIGFSHVISSGGGVDWWDSKKGKVKDKAREHEFRSLYAEEVYEYGERLDPATAKRLADKVKAVMNLRATGYTLTNVNDFWFNFKDDVQGIQALREKAAVDDTNIEGFYGQFATATGIEGLSGATVKEGVSWAINTLHPSLTDKERRVLTVDALAGGLDEAGVEGQKVIRLMFLKDPESFVGRLPSTSSMVPPEFRAEMIEMYTASGTMWRESDITDVWLQRVNEMRGEDDFEKNLAERPNTLLELLSTTKTK